MPEARQTLSSSSILVRIAITIRTHATASALTPCVSGSPKKMRMASPTYLSIVPPNWRAIVDISVR